MSTYRRTLLFLLAVLVLLPIRPVRAQEANPPRILSSDTENHFPDSLTFRITAEGDAPIQKIWLYYHLQGDISTTRQALDFTPATRVSAAFTWNTAGITVPPSSPVLYFWEVEDADGRRTRSDEMRVYYHDVRFDWHELRREDLVVRWYQGDDRFGQLIFDTATEALDQMIAESGRGLEQPVFVVIYPNKEDFASWHTYVDEWVGGQAFPALGVTVEIIAPDDPESWIRDVIPHEIAHLFFYQAVNAALADWPHWLDEGMAQFYEFGSHERDLAQVSAAAKEGRLIPLTALSGSFGRDDAQVRLAYAEAISAVTYMHQTWGADGIAALIGALRGGQKIERAVQTAFGVSWEEFVAGWLTWMGVPATPAPSPTPTQGYVFPTAPSGWYTPTPAPTATDTPVPPTGSGVQSTVTPSPYPTVPPTAVLASTADDVPKNPKSGGIRPGQVIAFSVCCLVLLVLGLGAFLLWAARGRKSP